MDFDFKRFAQLCDQKWPKNRVNSQTSVARQFGFTQGELNHYRNGKREPAPDRIRKMASVLDVAAASLLKSRQIGPGPKGTAKVTKDWNEWQKVLFAAQDFIKQVPRGTEFQASLVLDPAMPSSTRSLFRADSERFLQGLPLQYSRKGHKITVRNC
jgi:transcriptional regulator with XRE-family HTH domain